MRHRFSLPPAVVLFCMNQDWGISAVHVHSLPVKPSAAEPENAQPELSRRSTRTLAPYEHAREEHCATKHSPYSFLIVRPRRNCKGGHASWMVLLPQSSQHSETQISTDRSPFLILKNEDQLRSIQSPELPFNQIWTTVCKTGCISIVAICCKTRCTENPGAAAETALGTAVPAQCQRWGRAQTSWETCHL